MDVGPPLSILKRETQYDHAPRDEGPPLIAYNLAGDKNPIAGYSFRSQEIDRVGQSYVIYASM
jgi:hypothetical protein